MTIRRKLRLSLILAGLVALALLAALVWTQGRIEQLGRAAVLANEVVITVFELDRLTYEVVYSGAERRAREQWELEHQTLERRLTDMLATGAESPAVERIAAAQLKLEDLFSRITTESLAGDEGNVVDREGLLKRRELVELIEHRLGGVPRLDLDDEPQAVVSIREVDDRLDAFDPPGRDSVLDLLNDALGSHQVRQLRDDDALALCGHVLDAFARRRCRRNGNVSSRNWSARRNR